MNRIYLFTALFCLCFAAACVDDDDAFAAVPSEPELPPCELGNQRADGSDVCSCPEPGILLNGRCQVLRESEYFATSYDCFCTDSMFLRIGTDTIYDSFGAMLPKGFYQYVSGGEELDFPGIAYFSLARPWADTLYIGTVLRVDGETCLWEDGESYQSVLRIYDFEHGKDTLWGQVVQHRGTTILDTCRMLFRR